MYEAFFGLRSKPFSALPDPDFLYLSRQHRLALSLLGYCLRGEAGIAVVSGEVGSGKTTLIRRLLRDAAANVHVGLITQTPESPEELLRWTLYALGADPHTGNRVELYSVLAGLLEDRYREGRRTVLVIDEAQNLSVTTLEHLRMLSNLNADDRQLLQTILVGQPELLEKLKKPELRQLAQRVAVDFHLGPLPYEDTRAYIAHRVGIAGGAADLFDGEACAAVHYVARGVPRLINNVCDLALVYAYAADRPKITLASVLEVVNDRAATGLAPLAGVVRGHTDSAAIRKFVHAVQGGGQVPRKRKRVVKVPAQQAASAETDAAPVSSATAPVPADVSVATNR